MKRLLILSATAILILGVTGCEETVELTAPANFEISAATDEISVVLDWSPNPSDESIDGYVVYFNDEAIDTTENETYTHTDPQETGTYFVTAYRGDEESVSSGELSTVPVVEDNITLAEINATGNSGLGWDRTDGSPTTYSMEDATNASVIDFYFSNWAAAFAEPYYFISPDLVTTDPGVTWTMTGTWNESGFTLALTDNFDSLTVLPGTGNYTNSQEVTTTNATYGFYSVTDDYFGMVEVKSINYTTGEVEVRVAFQPVQGLRILEH